MVENATVPGAEFGFGKNLGSRGSKIFEMNSMVPIIFSGLQRDSSDYKAKLPPEREGEEF